MRFPFNPFDSKIQELLKYAGNEKLLEQAMHNAYHDTKHEKGTPVKIDLIIKHIGILKQYEKETK